MKKLAILVLLTLAACGGGDNEDAKAPVRLLRPGVLLSGPAGGGERIGFTDGSSVNFTVSGRMALTLPKGVYLDSTFPADVTFAVRSQTGDDRTGKAAFARVRLDSNKRFTGETETASGAATLTGAFVTVTDTTYADILSFSYSLSATGGATHTIYLQSERLDQDRLALQP